jgi:hypothetical protein
MKKVLLLFSLLQSFACFAQQILVTGKISDTFGKAIPFAAVTIKHTKAGVQSDADGVYLIKASLKTDTLLISAVGYLSVEVPVVADTLNVLMTLSESTLNEVVVTSAFGLGRTSRSVASKVSAISVVSGESFGFKTWQRSGLPENSVQLSVGDKDFIPLKAVQVSVQVDGFRARILFDYFFYSDKDKNLRGDFRLKLPNGASPFYFAFGGTEYLNKDKAKTPYAAYKNGQPIILQKDSIRKRRTEIWSDVKEARVAPKEKAASAFNEVVRGRIDPALAEWAGADVFSCSVYPIQQNKLHRIVFGYDINLLEIGNESMLRLSLPFKNIDKNIDIDIAATGGLQEKIEPVIPGKTIANGRVRYSARNFKPDEYSISLHSPSHVFLKSTGPDNFFAVSYKPEIPLSGKATVEKDAIFLLDISLSSQPDKMNVWLKTIEGILNNNRKQIKRFAVLCFNVDAGWWQNYYVENNSNSVEKFLDYAQQLSLVGATDLQHALRIASRPAWMRNKKPKTLFLLSDGDASWGENNLYQLSSGIANGDKIFSFTTGFSETDTRVLDHLSRQTGGAVFSVLNEDEVTKASTAIQSLPWRIKSITCPGTTDLLIAGRPYYIFPGQKLIITGRGSLHPGTIVTLTVTQGDIEKIFEIPVEQVLASCVTNRIYGQVAVNQLEDFSFKSEKASTQYAIHFEIPGQTCSFVMLESGDLYNRYGIDGISTSRFIENNLVNDIIQNILAEEKSSASLGSAKADMKAWLEKMNRDGILSFNGDSLFNRNLDVIPEAGFIVGVKPLTTRNLTNDQWYDATLTELGKPVLDYDQLMKMIMREKRWSGKEDAFKLISSFAEKNRADFTLMREVAYTLGNWNMDDRAYQLLRRIILARPAEPAAYLMIANCLIKMNKADLATIYYDLAFLNEWDDRFDGFRLIAALQYSRFLRQVINHKYFLADTSFAAGRLKEIENYLRSEGVHSHTADLMVIITWNTDNTDVDLHVREPSGEKCNYSHPKTASGGFLSNDATEGFGPEMYYLQNAPTGNYHIDIDYYSSSFVRSGTKSKILVDVYKYWGTIKEEHIQKVVELKKSKVSNEDDEV